MTIQRLSDTFMTFLELNNTRDANAIVVVDSNRQIVGHIPSRFCNVLAQLMRRFTGNWKLGK